MAFKFSLQAQLASSAKNEKQAEAFSCSTYVTDGLTKNYSPNLLSHLAIARRGG